MDKILSLIKEEEKRQKDTLMMIPSENYTYPDVRKAVGSVLMHKYSEGYPKRRYYQGNEIVDQIEILCQERALSLFNLNPKDWSVNVQALSGTPANLAIMNALLEQGDTILSMYLYDGGHLSHGWSYKGKKITLSSKIWNIEFYYVDPKTGVFDYEKIEKVAKKVKPKLIVSGGTAYPREIDHQKLGKIAKSVGAYYLADVSHEAGLIAAGANKSPFKYADVVMATTHKTLRGPRGALIFSRSKLAEKIDSSVFPGTQGGPHNEIIAGIAVALKNAKSKEFKKYAAQVVVNAKALARELSDLGFTIISDGTEKHLILIDMRPFELNGWFVGHALETAGIIVNRSTIPSDPASPYYPSGIRLGTPAITARGMKEKEMKKIAVWIASVVNHLEKVQIPEDKDERKTILKEFKSKVKSDKFLLGIAKEVKTLCSKFPVDLS
ncbi:MAG TPA: serine hydroxymethyltransferase [Patescibacteria group bacterium]